MFDFDTILYFILGVLVVLIFLHNLSKFFPVQENMLPKRKKGKKKKINKSKSSEAQQTPEIEEGDMDAEVMDDDFDDPVPNYSVPVNENTVESMEIELDKEVVLEPHEIETIDEELE